MRILSTRSEKKTIEATICKNVHVCIPCSARDTHSKVTHSHSNFPLANNHHHNRCSCRLIFSYFGCRQRKCPAKMNLKFLRFHNECMYGCHIQCQNVAAAAGTGFATVAVGFFSFSFRNVNVSVFETKDLIARYYSVYSTLYTLLEIQRSHFVCNKRYYVTENLAKCLYKGRMYSYAVQTKTEIFGPFKLYLQMCSHMRWNVYRYRVKLVALFSLSLSSYTLNSL